TVTTQDTVKTDTSTDAIQTTPEADSQKFAQEFVQAKTDDEREAIKRRYQLDKTYPAKKPVVASNKVETVTTQDTVKTDTSTDAIQATPEADSQKFAQEFALAKTDDEREAVKHKYQLDKTYPVKDSVVTPSAGHFASGEGRKSSSEARGFGRRKNNADGATNSQQSQSAATEATPESGSMQFAKEFAQATNDAEREAVKKKYQLDETYPTEKPVARNQQVDAEESGSEDGDTPPGHHTSKNGKNSDSSQRNAWNRKGNGKTENENEEEVESESESENPETGSGHKNSEGSRNRKAQSEALIASKPEPEFDREMVAAMVATPVEIRNNATMQLFSGHHQMISGFRNGSKARGAAIAREDMDEVKRSVNGGMNLHVGGIYSYMRANGSRSNVDLSNGLPGYKGKGFGFEAGVFHVVDTELLAGLMLSGQHNHASFKKSGGSVDIDTVRLGPFMSWKRGNFHIDAALTVGHSQVSAKGHDKISGEKYKGENGITDWAGWIGTGYDIHLDNFVPGLTVTPMAEFLYIDSRISGLNLKNQDKTRVKVKGGSRHDRIDRYGLMMSYVAPGSNGDLEFHGGAGIQHNHFASHKVNMTHADGTQSVTQNQEKTDRRLNWVSLGMSQKLGQDKKISFDLESTSGKHSRSYGASATFEYKFK
ncbi:autotransporter domain-containing protein, partial [Sansalvadorimonas sp. 2012CJ34-2]